MAVEYPIIGRWYRRSNGSLFEIVAVDLDDGTVELQYFDGTIDEIELENWPNLILESVGAPEDWLGALDMDPEDFAPNYTDELPVNYADPTEFLEIID